MEIDEEWVEVVCVEIVCLNTFSNWVEIGKVHILVWVDVDVVVLHLCMFLMKVYFGEMVCNDRLVVNWCYRVCDGEMMCNAEWYFDGTMHLFWVTMKEGQVG